MTFEEMKAEAEEVANRLAATRQRAWVMKREELVTLLIDAYCRGHKAGVDKSVAAFAPSKLAEYRRLTS